MTDFDDPNGLRRTVAEYGVGEQVLVNRMIIVAMFHEIDRLRVELGEQDGWQAEAKARIAELEDMTCEMEWGVWHADDHAWSLLSRSEAGAFVFWKSMAPHNGHLSVRRLASSRKKDREIDRLRDRIAELEAELNMCTADCAAARQDRHRDD